MNDEERNQIESELRQGLKNGYVGVPRRVTACRQFAPWVDMRNEPHHSERRELPLMTKEIRQRLPKLYATADIDDPVIQIRYKAWRYCDWNVIEFDGEDIFFGFVWVESPTWGYFRLSDLEAVQVPHCASGISVDRYFEPEPVSQAFLGYYHNGPC